MSGIPERTTLVIEDDRECFVQYAALHAALVHRGPVLWAASVHTAEELLKQPGFPDYLVVDHDLGDGYGLNLINRLSNTGRIPPEAVVTAFSTSNRMVLSNERDRLGKIGIGAFPKWHFAEGDVWCAYRGNGHPIVPITDIYEPADFNFFSMTPFGEQVDGLFAQFPFLNNIHPSNMPEWPPMDLDGQVVIPADQSIGLFDRWVRSPGFDLRIATSCSINVLQQFI